MSEAEFKKQLLTLSNQVEDFATKLVSESEFSVTQVSFILASVGSSLLSVQGGDQAAIRLLRAIADDIERGVKPTPMQ